MQFDEVIRGSGKEWIGPMMCHREEGDVYKEAGGAC